MSDTYSAVYTCLNCGQKHYTEVKRGETMPILVPAKEISEMAEKKRMEQAGTRV